MEAPAAGEGLKGQCSAAVYDPKGMRNSFPDWGSTDNYCRHCEVDEYFESRDQCALLMFSLDCHPYYRRTLACSRPAFVLTTNAIGKRGTVMLLSLILIGPIAEDKGILSTRYGRITRRG